MALKIYTFDLGAVKSPVMMDRDREIPNNQCMLKFCIKNKYHLRVHLENDFFLKDHGHQEVNCLAFQFDDQLVLNKCVVLSITTPSLYLFLLIDSITCLFMLYTNCSKSFLSVTINVLTKSLKG